MNPDTFRSDWMPVMTQRRMVSLQRAVRQPKAAKGSLTSYVQDKARIELLAHAMGRGKKLQWPAPRA